MTGGHVHEVDVGQLTSELVRVRQRGLDNIDDDRGAQRPVDLPLLEHVARTTLGKVDGSRIDVIRDFLRRALDEYADSQNRAEADIVRRLLRDDDDRWPGPAGPGALLDRVRRSEGLDGEASRKEQRRCLERLARFLVAYQDRDAPGVQQAGDAGPGSRIRQLPLRWLGAGIATVVVVVVVVILTIFFGQAAPSANAPGTSMPPTTRSAKAPVWFRFDSLGGTGSHIIDVYPGVGETERDRTKDGTYASGQRVIAVCLTTGRLIRSVPADGERHRASNRWIRISSAPGTVRYASLTYGELIPGSATLPTCQGR